MLGDFEGGKLLEKKNTFTDFIDSAAMGHAARYSPMRMEVHYRDDDTGRSFKHTLKLAY